jgi:formylglycine-generating enzyme required for sulfatase activity
MKSKRVQGSLREDRAMTRRILFVLGLVLALGVAVSQGEWKMRVHEGAGVTEFAVSGVDSLTFYETLAPPMVTVPAGVFIMGDGEAYCGTQQHQVTLTRDFYLGRHEVTNQEYVKAVQWAYDHDYVTATTASVLDNLDGSTEELLDLDAEWGEIQFDGIGSFYLRESPSSFAQGAYPTGYDPSDHPVKEVTWYGAVRYCDWLSLETGLPRAYQHGGNWSCNGGNPYGAHGYRLQTDAEWEYAAQWNDERIYPWGNEAPDCNRANFYPAAGYCVGWTSPVGSYPDAPAVLGLSDMAGNVWEWCNDWHVCDLGTDAAIDPIGPSSGVRRVLRGDGYAHDDGWMRCAVRNGYYEPSASGGSMGFRVARTLMP